VDLLGVVRDLGDYNIGGASRGYYTWLIDTNQTPEHEIDRSFGLGQLGTSTVGRRDIPVVGDWNNDGFDDMGVVRQELTEVSTTQEYLVWYLDTDGDSDVELGPYVFGLPGDIPVVGDWDKNGVDDPGVVRSVNGQLVWYFDTAPNASNGNAEFSLTFGTAGSIPVAGDWDGDGYTDPGYVTRTSTSLEWRIQNQVNGVLRTTPYPVTTFGSRNMVPVVGNWDTNNADNFAYVDVSTSPLKWHIDTDANYATVDRQVSYGLPGSATIPRDIPVVGNFRYEEVRAFRVMTGSPEVLDTEQMNSPIVQTLPQVALNSTPSGTSAVFQIRNTGNSNLSLSGLTVPAAFEVTEGLASTLGPGSTDNITIRVRNQVAGTFEGEVAFATSDDNERQFNIPISATVLGPRVIAFEVSHNGTLTFGPTNIETENIRTITIRNDGNSNATLSALSVSGGFSLEAGFGATTLAPTEFTTFKVRMQTTGAPGTRTGTVSFNTNQVTLPTFTFNLQGTVAALPHVDYPGVIRRRGTAVSEWLLDTDRDRPAELRLEYGLTGDTIVTGDWIADGVNQSYAGVVRQSNGRLLWLLDTDNDPSEELRFIYGLSTDIPMAGDFNGDGRDDFAVVRPGATDAATGRRVLEWYITTAALPALDSNADIPSLVHNIVITYGLEGDSIVVGDWNADGRDDVGRILRNTAAGTLRDWEMATFSSQTVLSSAFTRFNYVVGSTFEFGRVPDPAVITQTHIVGDWDGDGDDDAGIIEYRLLPGGGTDPAERRRWYLDRNRDPHVDYDFQYGLPSDIPVAGRWKIPEVSVLNSASAALSPLALNFGTLARGTTNAQRTQNITLRNDGTAALIGSIPASSGVFDFSPSGAFNIPIGGQLSVAVKLGDQFTGSQSDSLTINSNDPDEGVIQIALSGTITGPRAVFAEVGVNGGVIDFRKVNQDVNSTRTITIYNFGTTDLTVGEVSVVGGDFPIKRIIQPGLSVIPARPNDAIKPHTTFTIEMDTSRYTTSNGTDFQGRMGTIQVVTGDPRASNFRFTVQGGVDVVNTQEIGVVRNGSWLLDLDRDPTNELNIRYGFATDRPVVGNWDGGTREHIGVVRPHPTNGLLQWLLDTNDAAPADVSFSFGFPTDIPVVGDWDGDGTDNAGVVRIETDAQGRRKYRWYLDLDGDQDAEANYYFGADDGTSTLLVPVAGKWVQGDPRDHLGVVALESGSDLLHWYFETNRPADTNLHVNPITPTATVTAEFGLRGHKVVVGDWDADGDSDVGAVWDGASDGLLRWYLGLNLSNPQQNSGRPQVDPHVDFEVTYGFPGDIPVVGQWLPPRRRPVVEGRIWEDDGDGVFETGEAPRAGVTVFVDHNRNETLDSGKEESTQTDSEGRYRFSDLLPGSSPIAIVTGENIGLKTVFPPNQQITTTPLFRITDQLANLVDQQRVTLSNVVSNKTVATPPPVSADTGGVNPSNTAGIRTFRQNSNFSDIDGRGYSVVVIDSGIDLDHPAFGPDTNFDGVGDRIVYHRSFVPGDASASDQNGHGTHVSGIIAGSTSYLGATGAYVGVAPGADIIHLKVLGSGATGLQPLQEALQWVVANTAVYNIAAVNLSLAGGNFALSGSDVALDDEFAALEALRVIVTAASGNEHGVVNGQPTALGVAYPAVDPRVLAVGAAYSIPIAAGDRVWPTGVTDKAEIAHNEIAGFSQRKAGLIDIFAPGVSILGPAIGGGMQILSGTSQAAPFVTGAAVLMQQLAESRLGQRLTPAEFLRLVQDSGTAIFDGDDEVSIPAINRIAQTTELDSLNVSALANAILQKAQQQTYVMNLAVSDSKVANFGVQLIGASLPTPGSIQGTIAGWASLSSNDRAATKVRIQQKYLSPAPAPIDVSINADGSYSRSNLPVGSYEVELLVGASVQQTSPDDRSFRGLKAVTAGTIATGVTTVDINGDSKLDLAIIGSRSGSTSNALKTVELFTNTTPNVVGTEAQPPAFAAAGTLELPSTLTNPTGVASIAQGTNSWLTVAAEYDSAGTDRGAIALYQRTNSASFSAPAIAHFGSLFRPRQLHVADVDGDSDDDLIVTNSHAPAVNATTNLGLLRRLSSAFETLTFSTAGRAIFDLATADLNTDGRLDLVTAFGDGIAIHYGISAASGAVPFGPANRIMNLGASIEKVSVGDINGDGRPDVVIGRGLTSDAALSNWGVLLNQSTNSSTSQVSFSSLFTGGAIGGTSSGKAQAVTTLTARDLNDDGAADIAATLANEKDLFVLFNERAATGASFLPAVAFEPAAAVQGVVPSASLVAELNGDEYPEVVTANGHFETADGITQGYFDVFQNGLDAGSHLVTLRSGSVGKADFGVASFTNALPQLSVPATLQVSESTAPQTVIGTATATDADATQTLTFSLPNAPAGLPVEINSANGQLTLIAPLDFETATSFTFDVQVADSLNGSVTKSVTLQVGDEREAVEITASQWPESGSLTVSVESGVLVIRPTADPTATSLIPGHGLASVSSLSITGREAIDDELTLLLGAGQLPLPTTGLTFDGATGSDTVRIVGPQTPLVSVNSQLGASQDAVTVVTWNQQTIALNGIETLLDDVATHRRGIAVAPTFTQAIELRPTTAAGTLNAPLTHTRLLVLGATIPVVPTVISSLPIAPPNGRAEFVVTLGAGNDVVDFTTLPTTTSFVATVNGGAGADSIIGTVGADSLNGDDGNDSIFGGSGNDLIAGGAGNDSIIGGAGADNISAGDGADSVLAGTGNDTVVGGLGNDILNGQDNDDSISGGSGIDRVVGGNGNDTLSGGTENDVLQGDAGNDQLFGDDGHDMLVGGDGADTADGGLGNDTIRGEFGGDRIFGGAGADSLSGGADADFLDGGDGDDVVNGDAGTDSVNGGNGNDRLSGFLGNDVFNGGADTDFITESLDGDATVTGTNVTSATLGADTTLNVERLHLTGGAGANKFDARLATITVRLFGGDGSDTLLGGSKIDSLDGGNGDDVLSGGASNDVFNGGAGTDFVYERADTNFTLNATQLSSAVSGTETLVGIERVALVGGVSNNVIDASAATLPVILLGAGGNDTLRGGSADDILIGGSRATSAAGVDSLIGNGGADKFDNDAADARSTDGFDAILADVLTSLPNWLDAL